MDPLEVDGHQRRGADDAGRHEHAPHVEQGVQRSADRAARRRLAAPPPRQQPRGIQDRQHRRGDEQPQQILRHLRNRRRRQPRRPASDPREQDRGLHRVDADQRRDEDEREQENERRAKRPRPRHESAECREKARKRQPYRLVRPRAYRGMAEHLESDHHQWRE